MHSREIAITAAITLVAEMNGEVLAYENFDCNFVLRELTGRDSCSSATDSTCLV